MSDAPVAALQDIRFDRVPGWADDDHSAAFAAFRRSAAAVAEKIPRTRQLGFRGEDLGPVARAALAEPLRIDRVAAREFFERWFDPVAVQLPAGAGFVTGYYEPEVSGSIQPSTEFPVPIHALPEDLVELGPGDDRDGLDPSITWARRLPDGRLVEHEDRGAIMAGALQGRLRPLCHVANWVEAFFIHVQGSARVRLPDGAILRVTFAGKSGHAYFPIARVLVERGLMPTAEATADVLRAYLLDHPDEATGIMARNRSYIFFRATPEGDPALGPVAAAGVPLTPGRSLAVDRHLHTFHHPVFVSADLGGGAPFRRLMVAQDTGSAILGPARGDIFFGSGDEAWRLAARVRHKAEFIVLRPRAAPRGP